MKRIVTFLLVLVLVLSLSATAFAADEIGLVEYRKRDGLSFLPGFKEGELSYPTDLFPAFKDVMPGDVLHQQVKITNKGTGPYNIVVYIKAEGSSENEALIEKLQLQVEYKDKDILYPGEEYDPTGVSDWKRLTTLSAGKSTTLDLTLTVPADLTGEEFEQTHGTVVWKFKVEEIPLDPTSPKTGDTAELMQWIAVLGVTALGMVVLFAAKKKKRA